MNVIISKGDKPLRYALGESVKPSEWDFSISRLKEDADDADYINDIIDTYVKGVKTYIRKYKSDTQKSPSKEAVTNFLNTLYCDDTPIVTTTFLEYAENLISAHSKDLENYTVGTIRIYNRAMRYLKEYIADEKNHYKKLTWSLFNADFCYNFQQYLLKRKFASNTVTSLWNKIKAILYQADLDGFIDAKFLKTKKLKRSFDDADTFALEEYEVQQIKKAKVNKPNLIRHRDAYVLNCYLGFRFEDYTKADKNDIIMMRGKKFVKRKTGKSNKFVLLPLAAEAEEILMRYEGQFPKVGTNNEWNDDMKIIALAAGLTDDVNKVENVGGKDVEKVYQKWELVTIHTSRRTFATMLYDVGVDIYKISQFLAHRNIKTTKKYIKSDSRKIAMQMAQIPFFSGEHAKTRNIWEQTG